MEYPNLLLAIRASGRPQYQVAQGTGIREGRLSEILRRGSAKPEERYALSLNLGLSETVLFESSVPGLRCQRASRLGTGAK